MKRYIRHIICLIICVSIALTSFSAMALTQSEKDKLNSDIASLKEEANAIQAEINKLKNEKADQNAILTAIRKKIANTQAQIDRCNSEIASINATIAANKKDIEAKEAEIEDDIFAYKKRLSAMYMSGSNNNIQILLGAENFSDFLRISQYTDSMSARDKKLIDGLKKEIEVLNEKNAENEKLIESQVSIKADIDKQQSELEAQETEAAAIYNKLASEQNEQQKDLNAINAEVRKLQKKLEDDIASKKYESFINNNTGLQWPVSGFMYVSSHFGPRWGTNHNGIDIAGGGISGQPIRAIADGYVTLAYNGCSHNYKKSGNCCGNGYGNYCTVNHGTLTINGSSANYVAYYAHASKIIVSNGQYVKQGQVLGYVGTTGWSTGYHLHLGVLRNGKWINPYPLFF